MQLKFSKSGFFHLINLKRVGALSLSFLVLLLIQSNLEAKEYLVKLKAERAASFLSQKSNHVKSHRSLSFGEFVVIDIDENQEKSWRNNPEFEYMEENIIFHTTLPKSQYQIIPMARRNGVKISDTDFSRQWGLENTGRNSGGLFGIGGKKGMDINMLNAWKLSRGSEEIKIAVIDTGVDWTHPDLVGNILINEAELNGEDGVDDDGNGFVDDVYGWNFAENNNNPKDQHGHGTHCAGVIGASHNNIGIRGVMAQVKILPIQFLSRSGSGTLEGAVGAIDYAISRGVHVMSNSWGGRGESQALNEAVQRAHDAGIVFVAAAGNERANNDTVNVLPANINVPNVISVGAMDGAGKRASFSNFGVNKVHVFAPGVNTYSTVPNNRYQNMSGTSMACPHVAGVAGLMLAVNPNLTPEQVKELLIKTTKPGDNLSSFAQGGLVDSAAALEASL